MKLKRGEQQEVRELTGTNIRRCRHSVDWSIEKLAIRADLSPDYLGRVERGEKNIGIDALSRLAQVLRVPVYVLLMKPEEQKNLNS